MGLPPTLDPPSWRVVSLTTRAAAVSATQRPQQLVPAGEHHRPRGTRDREPGSSLARLAAPYRTEASPARRSQPDGSRPGDGEPVRARQRTGAVRRRREGVRRSDRGRPAKAAAMCSSTAEARRRVARREASARHAMNRSRRPRLVRLAATATATSRPRDIALSSADVVSEPLHVAIASYAIRCE
jgi:hypothetical protein